MEKIEEKGKVAMKLDKKCPKKLIKSPREVGGLKYGFLEPSEIKCKLMKKKAAIRKHLFRLEKNV